MGTHPEKLNELAGCHQRRTPIPRTSSCSSTATRFRCARLDTWLTELLADAPLAAVRRDENAGDIQPHPCFCVTTVGFWNEIEGDWRNGSWLTAEGTMASDVGGTLLAILECAVDCVATNLAFERRQSPSGVLRALRAARLPPRLRLPSSDRPGGSRTTFPSRRTRSISTGRRELTGSRSVSFGLVTRSAWPGSPSTRCGREG